jgi:iron complex outermembrane receptor protein
MSDDRVADRLGLNFQPNSDLLQNYNLFFQDEFALHRKFRLTVGSKFELQDYVGLEVQPNVRGAWLINPANTLWASISRAVRTPTRFDRDIRVTAVTSPPPTFTAISFRGSTSFQSEELLAYEAGWRSKPSKRVFFDVTGFYNVYDNLMSLDLGQPFAAATVPGLTIYPTYFGNKASAESYGVEVVPQIQVTDWWKMQMQYSYLHLRIHVDSDAYENPLTPTPPTEKNSPAHQASLRNSFNLPHNFEVDAAVRYVDNLHNLRVPSYTVADVRLGWTGIRNMNFEVIGQNLMERRHIEFRPGNEVERGVYGRVTWNY